jgi:hypothetical protein
MSSQSVGQATINPDVRGGAVVGGVTALRKGKENCRGKEVEGLVIFGKRGGEMICREQVLSELRAKRTELGGTI